MSQLHFLSALEAGRRIATGEVSPVALTEALLARIDALQPRLHAYATVTADLALAQARAAAAEIDRGQIRGPLHGVPIALKDLCCTKGIVTAAGMPLHAANVPDHDATVTARLRDAGAVLLGKLQMTEGAFSAHHPDITPPVNPWQADLWTGVSSSGSGVATAAGLCFGSLGSDTGGSIRFPSAANGLTGIKPTWGRVSRHGIFDLAASLDHVGPMARSALDAAAMLGAIAGPDSRDPTALQAPVPDYLAGAGRGLSGIKIGVDAEWNHTDVDPRAAAAVDQAVPVLAALGAEICQVSFPSVDDVVEDWISICAVEGAHAHRASYPARKDAYGPGLSALLDVGHKVKTLDLQAMLDRRAVFRGAVAELFATIDLLAVPAQFIAAPTNRDIAALRKRLEGGANLRRFTVPFDMTGQPTITFPCGFTEAGHPIAMQLVGGHPSEDLLVAAGHAYQTATDWHMRHPDL